MIDETQDQRWERLSKDRVDRPLPKRFYNTVTVGDDLSILLDGRAVKTPLKQTLIMPMRALAEAVAKEWRAQEKLINPATMPLTKLANTALDGVHAERTHVAGEVVSFAANDLVCYRAAEPAHLVARQAGAWDPVLAWAHTALNAQFVTTKGVIHVGQSVVALGAIERHIASFDAFALTAVHNAMTLTGSALLALMLQARAISAEAAWNAAHVDEDFQIAQWGEDDEASALRENRKAEFNATAQFMNLLGP